MTIKEMMTSNKPYISKYEEMDEKLKKKQKIYYGNLITQDQTMIKDVVRFYKNY